MNPYKNSQCGLFETAMLQRFGAFNFSFYLTPGDQSLGLGQLKGNQKLDLQRLDVDLQHSGYFLQKYADTKLVSYMSEAFGSLIEHTTFLELSCSTLETAVVNLSELMRLCKSREEVKLIARCFTNHFYNLKTLHLFTRPESMLPCDSEDEPAHLVLLTVKAVCARSTLQSLTLDLDLRHLCVLSDDKSQYQTICLNFLRLLSAYIRGSKSLKHLAISGATMQSLDLGTGRHEDAMGYVLAILQKEGIKELCIEEFPAYLVQDPEELTTLGIDVALEKLVLRLDCKDKSSY